MVLTEDDEMIETFDAETLQPAFHVGVHVRRSDAGADYLHVFAGEDRIKAGGKLRVVVANQVCRLLRLLLEDRIRLVNTRPPRAARGQVVGGRLGAWRSGAEIHRSRRFVVANGLQTCVTWDSRLSPKMELPQATAAVASGPAARLATPPPKDADRGSSGPADRARRRTHQRRDGGSSTSR
jgi:hypothetical protein